MQAYIISKFTNMVNLFKQKISSLLAIFVAFFLIGGIALAPASAQDDQWIFDDDGYTFTTTSDMTEEDALAVIAGMGMLFLILTFTVFLPMYIYFALVLMTIAKKLNVKNAWFAWIPILNVILMFQCAGLNPWLVLLLLVPVANIVVTVFAYMKIAERRGFEAWLGILIILPLANLIVPGYLAWGEPKAKAQ
jgi:hypothetical protein